MDNHVTIRRWHILAIEEALGFTNFCKVQIGICPTNRIGNRQRCAGSRQGIQFDLIRSPSNRIGDNLDEFFSLVVVDFLLI